MRHLGTRLRIGEKIGLGFGLVGLIFLGVILLYDLSLRAVITDLRELHAVHGARQLHAFEIASRLAAMRGAQERFLVTRDPALVEETRREAAGLRAEAGALERFDPASQASAQAIEARLSVYLEQFDAIVAAWAIKGLDERSGLQGAFRAAAHGLQERARDYQIDGLYMRFLRLHSEVTRLLARADADTADVLQSGLDALRALLVTSALPATTQGSLDEALAAYGAVLGTWIETARDVSGRDDVEAAVAAAVERVESILDAHQVPDLETRILELRRREKDYLLRGDSDYAAQVERILTDLRASIGASQLDATDRDGLHALLDAYARDFNALVEQDRLIARLALDMDVARSAITPLVEANLAQANARLESTSAEVIARASASARLRLAIAVAAALLGGLFAILIIARIVCPVRAMAELLDELTYRNPSERIPVDPNGRDEINAMAISLNTMADHKQAYLDWWRSSMREAIALRDLSTSALADEHQEASAELSRSLAAKLAQLDAVRERLGQHADALFELIEPIDPERPRLGTKEARALRGAAAEIRALVELLREPTRDHD